MNFFKKLLNEDVASTSHWQRDEDAPVCNGCRTPFSVTNRRHHCRNCGYVFCANCTSRQCTVPMRNIHSKVRVCDDCYVSLTGRHITSARPSEIPADSRAPSFSPNDGRNIGQHDAPRGPPARPDLDRGAAQAASSGGDPSEGVPPRTGGAQDSGTSPSPATSGPPPPQDNAQQAHAEATEAANAAYQQAYAAQESDDNAVFAVSSEQAERESLSRRWAQVRKDAQFVDILIQRVERVEADTPVEYSRETETITLQPEMPAAELARTLMPLPLPVESSARFLLDPVHPIILSDADAAGESVSAECKLQGEHMRATLAQQLSLLSSRVSLLRA